MIEIPQRVISMARKMRRDGDSWETIGEVTGYAPKTIRRRLDRDFRRSENLRQEYARKDIRHLTEYRVNPADLEARLAEIPPDVRDWPSIAFGDPIHPSRSALAQASENQPHDIMDIRTYDRIIRRRSAAFACGGNVYLQHMEKEVQHPERKTLTRYL